jgi:hypothetical protein
MTTFSATTDTFKNKEIVWSVNYNGSSVGQFWPIHGLNLVTDAVVTTESIADVQSALRGVATAPDGMTSGSFGSYTMQGMALSNGRPCGDGVDYDYGIVVVDKGFLISFTHHREHNVDSLYQAVKSRQGTMFYLPSIMRNGNALSSNKTVDKVFIRRMTPKGEQIGVILFNSMMTYDQARAIVTGLDRPGKSTTTHIYVLDGGSSWGQSCKEVNGTVQLVGKRNPAVVTNYLVFY